MNDSLFCSSCKLLKPKRDFWKRTCTRGYSYYCKDCDREKRRIKNISEGQRKKRNEYAKEYLQKNIVAERKRKLSVYRKLRHTDKWKATKFRSNSGRRSRYKNIKNTLTENDIHLLINKQYNKCARCRKEFNEYLIYTLDHIKPVLLGGETTIENIQLLCKSCNSSKGTKTINYLGT